MAENTLKTREVRAFGFVGAEVVRTLTEKLSDLAEEDAQEPIRLAMACYGSAWISSQAFHELEVVLRAGEALASGVESVRKLMAQLDIRVEDCVRLAYVDLVVRDTR